MLAILKSLQFIKPPCPYCGSLKIKYDSKLDYCDFCEQNILSQVKLQKENNIQSLIRWESGKNNLISQFIGHLKGERREKQWKYLANKMAQQIRLGNIENSVIIYPPSKSDNDHAALFAKESSKILSIPALSIFAYEDRKIEQKKMSKKDRLKLQLTLKREVIRNKHVIDKLLSSHVIFIDDVLTTGATARAAFEAIPKPQSFTIVVLANRIK